MERTVCSRFRLKKKIGAGSFGQIYSAENIVTHHRVAVKLEKANCRIPQLGFEAKLYKTLSGSANVPRLHYYGQDAMYNVLVIDLLGKSLEDLLIKCGRKMSLKTVLMLADQMISCVEFIHSKNYIHRDIKPDNFVMGVGSHANQVYMIDYGLAKRYRDQNTHQHIPYCEGKQLTGTARYASVSAMKGNEQSRRDDLEALGYVWIYLLKGSLPWMGIPVQNRQNKYDQICRMKARMTFEQICRGCPREFVTYFKTVRALKFTDAPDYASLRALFRDLFVSRGFVYDCQYDWSNPRAQNPPRPMTAVKRSIVVQRVDEEKPRRHSNVVSPRGANQKDPEYGYARRVSVANATQREMESRMLTESGKVSTVNGKEKERETAPATPENGRVSANGYRRIGGISFVDPGRVPATQKKRELGFVDAGRVSAGMKRREAEAPPKNQNVKRERDSEFVTRSGRLSGMKKERGDSELVTKSGKITITSRKKEATIEIERSKPWKMHNITTKVSLPRWANRLNVTSGRIC